MKKMITGLFGCSCHPFDNWKQCHDAHFQKLQTKQKVKNRCNGKQGIIDRVEKNYYFIVKYGPLKRDHILMHSAELIKL